MTKRFYISALLASVIASSVAGGSDVKKGQDVGGTEWRARMQSMLKDVLVLFPFAFDETKFNDPKNEAAIKDALRSLSEHSSGLKKHTTSVKPAAPIKTDPSYSFIAQAFETEISSAQSAFSEDRRRQAQGYIRSAISKCMGCHSQSAIGPQLNLDHFKNQFAALSPSDRFMAFAATRQFDQALKEFEQFLRDAKVTKPDPVAVDRQARAALAIAVRVKKDSKLTIALIDQMIASKAMSPMLLKDATDWRKTVIDWQTEKPQTLDSDKALYSEASRLNESGQKIENAAGHFENPDVPLLRATALLHDLLSKYPDSKLRAESYMLLASIYDRLPGFAIWDLADEYLGACVQENPHSEMGEKCFAKYKDSIIFGYTGSSGTNVPFAVSRQLQSLKELATRKK